MTPATPFLSLSLIGETEATDSEIDAYANRVLETISPPETSSIDDSLGPYVTSLLRCADIRDKGQVTKIAEFDSLLELVEDQCNIDKKKASDCVLLIADAVITHVLPFSERTATSCSSTTEGFNSNNIGNNSSNNNNNIHFGLYTQQGGLDSFRSLIGSSDFPDGIDSMTTATTATSLATIIGIPFTDSTSASMALGAPSPLKPDNLIPIDLMGELDDPSPTYSSPSTTTKSALHTQQQEQPQSYYTAQQAPYRPRRHSFSQPPRTTQPGHHSQGIQQQQRDDDFPPLGSSPEAFPPLGSSKTEKTKTDKPKKARIGSSKKRSSHGKSQQHSDKDLAATLFRPARPRQNSIESEEVAVSTRSRGSSNASASMMTTMASTIEEGGIDHGSNNTTGANTNFYFQQQLNSCVEILLSMNQELSEEAAAEAGLMANTDFNLAQHIVDSAMNAPPICRHMLHDGCYRSDCTFSHDVEGHTCLFWLRGRCGKGNSCRFYHGFHQKLLDNIADQQEQQQQLMSSYQIYPASSSASTTTTSSSMNSGGFGGTQSFSPLLSSSWHSPSLLESAASASATCIPSTPSSSAPESAPFSFANIASKGYDKKKANFSEAVSSSPVNGSGGTKTSLLSRKDLERQIPTVRIPQDLWQSHENRDSSLFYIGDPMERYQKVTASTKRSDVIDLHFQSIKTFPIVLETMLPLKLNNNNTNIENHNNSKKNLRQQQNQVWIVTGTGHHVGNKTHQKGGGALESAVVAWLVGKDYKFSRGKDRNGLSGALLVVNR